MTTPEPPEPGVEGWVGQILLDGKWCDYARGYEDETRRWQAAEPTKRRIRHWITGEVLVHATGNARFWAVSAQIEVQLENQTWTCTRQVPTFYLDANVQGITGEVGAMLIAEEILTGRHEGTTSITVTPVDAMDL